MFAVVFRSDKKVTSYNDTKIQHVLKNYAVVHLTNYYLICFEFYQFGQVVHWNLPIWSDSFKQLPGVDSLNLANQIEKPHNQRWPSAQKNEEWFVSLMVLQSYTYLLMHRIFLHFSAQKSAYFQFRITHAHIVKHFFF